jgi:hypothetical protein
MIFFPHFWHICIVTKLATLAMLQAEKLGKSFTTSSLGVLNNANYRTDYRLSRCEGTREFYSTVSGQSAAMRKG